MAYTRDKNSHTRHAGAIAAMDGVSSRVRRNTIAKARALAARDLALAKIANQRPGTMRAGALGAINQGYTGGSGGSVRLPTDIRFDYGTGSTPPVPTAPGGGSGGATTVPTSQTHIMSTAPQNFQVRPPPPPITIIEPQRPPPTPLPLPPPPEPVSPGRTPATSGGAPGGGGGGTWSPPPRQMTPIIEPFPAPPDIIEPSSSTGGISTNHLLIGGGLALAAYLIFKNKGS